MTKDDLIAAGIAAFGQRWQTEMALALGVSDRTIRNWVSGKYQIPDITSADVVLVLKRRKKEICDAISLRTEKFLMNPATGSVDSDENWIAEMPSWNDDPVECQRQFDTLIEVVKDEDGSWIEAT
ncbi:hypothetical protein [Edwardsiella anguillarum]|uniref:Helix-turn-helix domain-containing protein n=1 Tax=Edwardsiella anguillarum TaxID=1821960 RepID=A0ABY8SHN1_9GAMM|nr:hypothetical protein [Edwardsiella anguillarum]KAB0585072.1 helix-turn-helix domain-containing protein [Edwardsiella anguillarum]UOU79942.1 helix-turn-helix domain-containing protein [Edwardsiella anguillarum]WHP85184.1 helix-turn-helix domain-containing protein [Edwardsiella anguillarum]WHP88967.1 helix-turn-helix domain-containing protein [Edwardsiella anguillarum]WHP92766.1 helix-turn-helix domain-containing protein [Edwardsiella anguillarum]